MPSKDFVWITGAKDWVFMAGVVVIVFASVAALGDTTEDRYNPSKRKGRASRVVGFYPVALMNLLCIVNLPDFRRGLVVRLGLPEPWSWVLTPIALILLFATSIAAWVATYGEESNKVPRWRWLALWALELAAFFGYITVVFGAWWSRSY